MNNFLLSSSHLKVNSPYIIKPKTILCYRGLWNGPDDFSGYFLIENSNKDLEWVDINLFLDEKWSGNSPTVAMLSHNLGLWAASNSIFPGTQTWTTNGSFSVISYNRLQVAVWGGGGGGGEAYGGSIDDVDENPAGTGGTSEFRSSTYVRGFGGGGGGGGFDSNSTQEGLGGSASGGNTNLTGNPGGEASSSASGSGGDARSSSETLLGTLTGGIGGASRNTSGSGYSGNIPGAGGGGAIHINLSDVGRGAGGGSGGLAIKLWNLNDSGYPIPGESIDVQVGSGGQGGGFIGSPFGNDGGNGARGEVRAAWD